MSAYSVSMPVASPPSCARSVPLRPPPGHFTRDPLQRRLLDADCRLRLLVAPAGFGKSVLLADCARECPHESAPLWLNCGGRSWSTAQLCSQLAELLGYPPTVLEAELTLALQREERDLWIFIDDYPREPDADLDACLDRLLSVSADGLRWWLASRRRPACNLPRLLLDGELLELSGSELRFSVDELATWLQHTNPAQSPRVESLHGMTRGWPAALRLLTIQGARDGAGASQCEEHSRLLRDYIEHEVLHDLPAELHDALSQLAQIARFNDQLCEHLLGVGEGAAWLQALRARGLFIDELEDQADWFEVFPPFATLLQQRAKAAPCASLHVHASQWFAAHGDVRTAVEHALKGGQPEVAASFLERFTEEQLLQGQDLALILRWRTELPDSLLVSTPRLILLNAWALLLAGRLEEAEECVDGLARFQPRADGPRTRELFAQWQAIKGIAAYGRGCAQDSRDNLSDALQGLPESAWAQTLLCRSALTLVAIGEGNLELAQQLSYQALKQARLCGSVVFEALLELDHGLLLEARGEFVRAEALLQRVLEQMDGPQLRQTPVYGRIQLRLGRLALRQGQRDTAAGLLHCGLEQTLACGDPGAFHGYLGLAELAVCHGDTAEAFARLAQAERTMQRQRVSEPIYRGILLLASSRLWMSQGHLERAREVATRVLDYRRRVKVMLPPPNFPEMISRFQLILLQLDLQDGRDVRVGLRALLDQALEQGRQALAGDLWLAYAEACGAAGDSATAARARQAGQTLHSRLSYHSLWFGLSDARHAQAGQPLGASAEAQLSSREVAVLSLIAQGLSNQEVAERLFISLHTVKTHARRINGKLGVARRTQAVARAKALGVL
jgi:LuxR family transcriptional regulator, maltose regulon positive regulatory protein